MLGLYCDESDDGETYALAGWLATSGAWDKIDPAWRSMLKTLVMPDGRPCKAFHAADIVNRDQIDHSPFRGWTFAQECEAFAKSIDVLADKSLCTTLLPIGCAAEIPREFKDVSRDSIWLVLFSRLIFELLEMYPLRLVLQVSFMFDDKPEIAPFAEASHRQAMEVLERRWPGRFQSIIAFGPDEDHPPLQAADLFAYEWRKWITDSRLAPSKAQRRSWARLREERPGGSLGRYQRSVFERALQAEDQSATWVRTVISNRPTCHD